MKLCISRLLQSEESVTFARNRAKLATDISAESNACASTLELIKASMKEERDQHDTLEGWLAMSPGRIS